MNDERDLASLELSATEECRCSDDKGICSACLSAVAAGVELQRRRAREILGHDLVGEVNAVVRFQPLPAGRFGGPVDPMDPDGDLAGYDGPTASPTSSHIEHLDDVELWRVGRSVGRTIYRQVGDGPSKADELVGMMDTRELAARVVDAVNATVEADQDERLRNLRAALAELGGVGDTLLGMYDQHLIDAARARRAELQADYDTAAATVAAMHAAAMGGTCPPVRGLVEDVADLRKILDDRGGSTGGTFTFTLDGQTTTPIPYNADASTAHALSLVHEERAQQLRRYSRDRDDQYMLGELTQAAAYYLTGDRLLWPWPSRRPRLSDSDLDEVVKAAALCVAEIERLERRGTA